MTLENYCGAPDHINNSGSSWGFNVLKWSILQEIPGFDADQHDETKKVFDSISEVCGLQFVYTKDVDQAHIFFTAKRGRRNQLDGPGGTLAYAYLPPRRNFKGKGLACVFDIDENWNSQIKFQNVCCHEVGHNLGLSHSSPNDGQRDLMDPTYDPAIAVMQPGDIERLRRLYGPPVARPEPKPEPPTVSPGSGDFLGFDVKVVILLNGTEFWRFDPFTIFERLSSDELIQPGGDADRTADSD